MLTATNCVYFDQKRRVVGQLNLTDTEIIFSSPSNKDIRISLSDVYGIQPSVPNSKHSFVSTSSLSIASSTFSMPTAESTAATSKKTHSTFSANRFKIGRNDLLRGSNFSLRNLEKMGDRISPENTTQYKWITIFALPGRVKGKQVVKKLKHKMWTFELTNSTPDLVEIDVINWIDAVRSLLFAGIVLIFIC